MREAAGEHQHQHVEGNEVNQKHVPTPRGHLSHSYSVIIQQHVYKIAQFLCYNSARTLHSPAS